MKCSLDFPSSYGLPKTGLISLSSLNSGFVVAFASARSGQEGSLSIFAHRSQLSSLVRR